MKRRSRWVLKGGKVVAHLLEEDVVEEITERLWLQYRIKVFRVRERIPREGAAPSTAGIPDLIGWISKHGLGVVNGDPMTVEAVFATALFIECKRPGGARRTAQTWFINAAKSAGCVAFFAESWADVVREMDMQCGIKLKEVA